MSIHRAGFAEALKETRKIAEAAGLLGRRHILNHRGAGLFFLGTIDGNDGGNLEGGFLSTHDPNRQQNIDEDNTPNSSGFSLQR